MVEGGYDLAGLGDCLRAAIRALAGDVAPRRCRTSTRPTPRADATLAAVRPHLAPYWTL